MDLHMVVNLDDIVDNVIQVHFIVCGWHLLVIGFVALLQSAWTILEIAMITLCIEKAHMSATTV